MSYASAVEQLYELGHELARTPSHKFDLAHMRVLLEALGNPQEKFRSVLIAGTNGKGSTAATPVIVTLSLHRDTMSDGCSHCTLWAVSPNILWSL